MDKTVIDGQSFFGRTVYITRAKGYAIAMVTVINDDPKTAVVHDLVVHEDIRGYGIGGQLLDDACKEAERLGTDRIKLAVEPQTWTEEWYERRGFMFAGFNTVNGHLCAVMEKDITRREPEEPRSSP